MWVWVQTPTAMTGIFPVLISPREQWQNIFKWVKTGSFQAGMQLGGRRGAVGVVWQPQVPESKGQQIGGGGGN
jgi:hypothetical protein